MYSAGGGFLSQKAPPAPSRKTIFGYHKGAHKAGVTGRIRSPRDSVKQQKKRAILDRPPQSNYIPNYEFPISSYSPFENKSHMAPYPSEEGFTGLAMVFS